MIGDIGNSMLKISFLNSPDTSSFNNPVDAALRANTTPGFLDSPDGQIYHVMHHASGQRRGVVLQCGPANAERERAYPTFVKWSAALAAQGYDAMRFDYRGIGESVGKFEEMTMTSWRDDAAFCAVHLARISQGAPLILHGARAGALIAAELFASGVGDALLLWAPPASAHALLWDTLRRNLVTQMMVNPGAPRQTREQLVATLEAGELLNVDGYFWSRSFWADAKRHVLELPSESEHRPWHVVHVRNSSRSAMNPNTLGHEEQVGTDPFWESSSLFSPQSDDLFKASLQWLESSLIRLGGSN